MSHVFLGGRSAAGLACCAALSALWLSLPPQGLKVQVGREREAFMHHLTSLFPHEAAGIRAFYQVPGGGGGFSGLLC